MISADLASKSRSRPYMIVFKMFYSSMLLVKNLQDLENVPPVYKSGYHKPYHTYWNYPKLNYYLRVLIELTLKACIRGVTHSA